MKRSKVRVEVGTKSLTFEYWKNQKLKRVKAIIFVKITFKDIPIKGLKKVEHYECEIISTSFSLTGRPAQIAVSKIKWQKAKVIFIKPRTILKIRIRQVKKIAREFMQRNPPVANNQDNFL
jgi:hypothetical protein